MLVLPRITAPASRRRSVMCASYGATIALEDARPGRALAALDRDEVLERRPGCRAAGGARRARRRRRARGGQPRVGGVGLGEGPFAIDREPGVERRRCRARPRRDGPPSARATRSRRRAGAPASSWARSRVGSAVMRTAQSPPRMAGTTMKSPSRSAALARTASTGSDGRHDVVAEDVLELDGLGGRRDVVGRHARPGSRTGRGCG